MTQRALLAAAAELARRGEPHVIATVVDVVGSAYRRPGARVVATRERTIAGAISGGCLETDIVRKGWWWTERGPAVVAFDGDDGTGSGCGGTVFVLVERAGQSAVDPLAVLASCMRDQRRAALATVFQSNDPLVPVGARVARVGDDVDGDVTDDELRGALAAACAGATHSHARSFGPVRALIEVIAPPPRLFVVGGGVDAVPVVDQARAVGWEVLVCTPHARVELRQRFARADRLVVAQPAEIARMVDASDRAAVVIMNHDLAHDRACLAALLPTGAAYLGQLGPRRRTAQLLAELGVAAPRLHAPVGLALGAETAEEIALAIVAEVQAVLAGASATQLREQVGEVHDACASAT